MLEFDRYTCGLPVRSKGMLNTKMDQAQTIKSGTWNVLIQFPLFSYGKKCVRKSTSFPERIAFDFGGTTAFMCQTFFSPNVPVKREIF